MSCGCEKLIEKVGQVTHEERDLIRKLYNRKTALNELILVLKNTSQQAGEVDEVMYQRVVQDIAETSSQFQTWWDQKSQKYNWKNVPGGQWTINFETCEVFLQSPNVCGQEVSNG